ncbi:hypothetical protein BH18GEM1_BH18GEM1_11290 [soil metagenome]
MRHAARSLLIALAVLGCEEDQRGIEGTFLFAFSEVEDTCDNDPDGTVTVQLTIEQDGEIVTVRFGEEAVLTGFVDERGLIQAEGEARVPVIVDGQAVIVESFMEVQIGIRPVRPEASARLTFDGTHPSRPGEACLQEFLGSGQRASLVPLIPTGPAAVAGMDAGE